MFSPSLCLISSHKTVTNNILTQRIDVRIKQQYMRGQQLAPCGHNKFNFPMPCYQLTIPRQFQHWLQQLHRTPNKSSCIFSSNLCQPQSSTRTCTYFIISSSLYSAPSYLQLSSYFHPRAPWASLLHSYSLQ